MKISNHIDSFAFLDGSVNFEKSFSIAFNPLVLIVLFIAGIAFSVNWVGKHTIIKFNKWLDNEKI